MVQPNLHGTQGVLVPPSEQQQPLPPTRAGAQADPPAWRTLPTPGSTVDESNLPDAAAADTVIVAAASAVTTAGSPVVELEIPDEGGDVGDPGATKERRRTFATRVWGFVREHWFLEGLGCAILLAFAWPNLGKKNGIIRADITVSYVVVALIFIISGMSLKTNILLKSFANWRMHLLIQTISLGITLLLGLGVGRLLGKTSFNDTLIKGLIIATSTPTTISSNVLMTKQAHGDEAGALTSAVLGNILGVFISPSLIFTFAGPLASPTSTTTTPTTSSTTSLDYKSTFTNLALTVVGPLLLGQLLQRLAPRVVQQLHRSFPLSTVNSGMLLALVWSVFCDTFAEKVEVDGASVVAVVGLDLAIFSAFTGVCFVAARTPWVRFSRPETVAIVMCGATKTVALGIPMINIIYSGSPLIGVLSTPLLIYHAEQLVAGSILVSWLKRWVDKHARLDEERLLSLPTSDGGGARADEAAASTGGEDHGGAERAGEKDGSGPLAKDAVVVELAV